jgi:alpha-tubulin suppressor-like RCC1 family protein
MDSDGGVFGGVATIAAGTSHTCAQKKDGSVWCWGWNNDGQVSPGAPLTNVPTPMKIF